MTELYILMGSFYVYGFNGAPTFTFVLLSFLTAFVLNNLLIPMSLFVSLEFIKLFQAQFMKWDIKMSYRNIPMQAVTSNLNEDLSQIQIIFSDKTGTLTENMMNYSKSSIGNGNIYNEKETPCSIKLDYGKDSPHEEVWKDNHFYSRNFLYNLACNNSINVILNQKTKEMVYDGSSVDEVALIECARNNGFTLLHRAQDIIELDVLGVTEKIQVLATIEFNSDRKRMTSILKFPGEKYMVYLKGADNVVSKLISKDDPILEVTLKNINNFAGEGLRTLLICGKEISKEEYDSWNVEYQKALSAASKDKKQLLENAEAAIEKNLTVYGATAVEDALQDQVAETIEFFRKAGIQVWVLTGDKRDTAVTIGKSSKLLSPTTIVCHCYGKTVDDVTVELTECLQKSMVSLLYSKTLIKLIIIILFVCL